MWQAGAAALALTISVHAPGKVTRGAQAGLRRATQSSLWNRRAGNGYHRLRRSGLVADPPSVPAPGLRCSDVAAACSRRIGAVRGCIWRAFQANGEGARTCWACEGLVALGHATPPRCHPPAHTKRSVLPFLPQSEQQQRSQARHTLRWPRSRAPLVRRDLPRALQRPHTALQEAGGVSATRVGAQRARLARPRCYHGAQPLAGAATAAPGRHVGARRRQPGRGRQDGPQVERGRRHGLRALLPGRCRQRLQGEAWGGGAAARAAAACVHCRRCAAPLAAAAAARSHPPPARLPATKPPAPQRTRLQFLFDIAVATFSQQGLPTRAQIDALQRTLSEWRGAGAFFCAP